MIKITSVVGTRPEAIKIAPVVLEALRRDGFSHRLVATGQHQDMFDDAIAGFGLGVDLHLDSSNSGNGSDAVSNMRAAIASALQCHSPDIVLVQGDTNTSLAAAQAAQDCGIKVGHVEAGLRTFNLDRPFPEERNRIAIGQIAALHFAPSDQALANLTSEGIKSGVYVTGNPGIDALMQAAGPPDRERRPNIVVTCHRRENFGAPLERICDALLAIVDQHEILLTLPVHPNPAVSATIDKRLSGHPRINLLAPMAYDKMVCAIRNATLVLSDSGGLQEECAALGTPLLLMREETERPELVASGNVILVGSDPAAITRETGRLLSDVAHRKQMSRPAFPYGTGNSAPKILDAIEHSLNVFT